MNYNKELDKIKKQIKKTIQHEESEEIKQKIDSQIDDTKSAKTNKQEYETSKQIPKKQDKIKKQRIYDPKDVETSDKKVTNRLSIPHESDIIIDNIKPSKLHYQNRHADLSPVDMDVKSIYF